MFSQIGCPCLVLHTSLLISNTYKQQKITLWKIDLTLINMSAAYLLNSSANALKGQITNPEYSIQCKKAYTNGEFLCAVSISSSAQTVILHL